MARRGNKKSPFKAFFLFNINYNKNNYLIILYHIYSLELPGY